MGRLKHFFHGTTANLNIGDTVTSRESLGRDSNFETTEASDDLTGWNPGDVAYATATPGGAAWYAARSAKREGTIGRVYRVAPVNADDVKEDIYGGGDNFTAVQSPSGFKVLGVHEDGIGAEWAGSDDTVVQD